MPFAAFHDRFPEIARAETRTIRFFESGRVERAYDFLELYCDERGCDCRRVLIQAWSGDFGKPESRAVISWGWEPDSFYHAWASYPLSAEDLEELRGPALLRLSPQSEEAPELLEWFERQVLEDEAYAARIVSHYELFRSTVEDGRGPGRGNRAQRRFEKRATRRRRRRRR